MYNQCVYERFQKKVPNMYSLSSKINYSCLRFHKIRKSKKGTVHNSIKGRGFIIKYEKTVNLDSKVEVKKEK